MPSREEIATALKEAQSIINTLTICTGNSPSKYQPFSKLAVQVKTMRCKNCNKVSDCVAYLVMGQDAKKFGCFSWEAKEDSNHE